MQRGTAAVSRMVEYDGSSGTEGKQGQMDLTSCLPDFLTTALMKC